MVDVTVPGDKSITHRALLFAALADGESRLSGLLDSADTRSTAAALRALGIDLPDGPLDALRVTGRGLHGLRPPDSAIDCGNSGTSARLLLGTLAGCPLEAVLTGDDSLRQRPMRRVTAPLTAAGARFDELGDHDRLPIRVRGRRPLGDIRHHNARSSAQVRTALVLAGLTGGAAVSVTEPHRSRDHTERLLAAMGAAIRVEADDAAGDAAGDAAAVRVTVEPRASLDPLELRVPGDFSSAAFFLVLGALRGPVRVRGVGTNPTRTGMLPVLRRMGVTVEVEDRSAGAAEPAGDIVAYPGELTPTEVAPAEVPSLIDEIPALAVLAARAPGETRFTGVAELRVKESDRIRAMADNLAALGAEAEAGADTLTVRGSDRPLRGDVDARGDHRIAMAFGVLAALPGNDIRIAGREAVAISYPAFWDQLERLDMELAAQ